MSADPLALDENHASACHERWIKKRNNLPNPEDNCDLPEEWYNEQCGQCRFFVPLRGVDALSSDWGLCSNPLSDFDRFAMFEHDGCSHYLGADAWISEYFSVCPENVAEE